MSAAGDRPRQSPQLRVKYLQYHDRGRSESNSNVQRSTRNVQSLESPVSYLPALRWPSEMSFHTSDSFLPSCIPPQTGGCAKAVLASVSFSMDATWRHTPKPQEQEPCLQWGQCSARMKNAGDARSIRDASACPSMIGWMAIGHPPRGTAHH